MVRREERDVPHGRRPAHVPADDLPGDGASARIRRPEVSSVVGEVEVEAAIGEPPRIGDGARHRDRSGERAVRRVQTAATRVPGAATEHSQPQRPRTSEKEGPGRRVRTVRGPEPTLREEHCPRPEPMDRSREHAVGLEPDRRRGGELAAPQVPVLGREQGNAGRELPAAGDRSVVPAHHALGSGGGAVGEPQLSWGVPGVPVGQPDREPGAAAGDHHLGRPGVAAHGRSGPDVLDEGLGGEAAGEQDGRGQQERHEDGSVLHGVEPRGAGPSAARWGWNASPGEGERGKDAFRADRPSRTRHAKPPVRNLGDRRIGQRPCGAGSPSTRRIGRRPRSDQRPEGCEFAYRVAPRHDRGVHEAAAAMRAFAGATRTAVAVPVARRDPRTQPVAAPLPDVAVHVVQAERVRKQRVHRRVDRPAVVQLRPIGDRGRIRERTRGLVGDVGRTAQRLAIGAGPPRGVASGSAGVLPLSAGRQVESQAPEQGVTLVPAHELDRVRRGDDASLTQDPLVRLPHGVAARIAAGVEPHPLPLRHLVLRHEERIEPHASNGSLELPSLRVEVRLARITLTTDQILAARQQHEHEGRVPVELELARAPARRDAP